MSGRHPSRGRESVQRVWPGCLNPPSLRTRGTHMPRPDGSCRVPGRFPR